MKTLTRHQQIVLMKRDGHNIHTPGAIHYYFKEIGARRVCMPPGRSGSYGDTIVFTDSLSEEHRLVLAADEIDRLQKQVA